MLISKLQKQQIQPLNELMLVKQQNRSQKLRLKKLELKKQKIHAPINGGSGATSEIHAPITRGFGAT